MLDLINYDNLRFFTYSNDKICKQPFRGIVVQFHGLGDSDIFDEDIAGLDESKPKTHAQTCGEFYAKQNVLYIIPYTNPWCWMSDNTVKFVDKLVSVLIEKYNLDDCPIMSTGPSMGGQSAFLWSARSKFIDRIPACVVNCPVCDVVGLSKKPIAFRTLFSTFYDDNKDFYDVIKNYSPLERVNELRDIDYFVFQCSSDTAIVKEMHSDKMVEKMKARGLNVNYFVEEGTGHCQLVEYSKLHRQCVLDSIDKANKKSK